MNKKDLVYQIRHKRTFLCIGLDTDINKIPKYLLDCDDPVFEFNKQIIDSTKDLCVAYKLNTAFYESNGIKGWESLIKTLDYIPKNIFTIADAKRGDIGNTSKMYAETFFKTISFDSVTVNPYMGSDSVKPFLNFDSKWVILLALTSNQGSMDFQNILDNENIPLYKNVIETSKNWGSEDNMMFVVGATKAAALAEIRKIIPNHFLLVPGVGAQGGSLKDVVENGMNHDCGLLINSSRSIIYSANDSGFASSARKSALKIKKEMEDFLD
jgi:orotidine-5'-phosphate decarboxylase